MVSQKDDYVKSKIDYLATTTDKISGRAGLALISRYLHECGITKILSKGFGFLKKHAKGTPLLSLFHQIIIFFFDGTDLHMTRFDHVKNDPVYVGIIETEENLIISSHTAKRFFYSISNVRVWLFRKILKQLFLWRLEIEKPDMIKIGIDTMVLDLLLAAGCTKILRFTSMIFLIISSTSTRKEKNVVPLRICK